MFSEVLLSKPDGKYVIMKDPNKPIVRLYAIPADAFERDEDDEEGNKPNPDPRRSTRLLPLMYFYFSLFLVELEGVEEEAEEVVEGEEEVAGEEVEEDIIIKPESAVEPV